MAVYEYMAKFPGVLPWKGGQILDWYQKTRRERDKTSSQRRSCPGNVRRGIMLVGCQQSLQWPRCWGCSIRI
jgi:hypothetical protein